MAVSLQSITELSVHPWENITGLRPLLNKSNFALPMAVPLFCQDYITDILYFPEVQTVLFWGCSRFRLDQPLPFLTGSLYHDHFCCLAILWIEGICSFFFSFLFSSVAFFLRPLFQWIE